MIATFEKLTEKPDVIFVPGQGISHQRLGLASHFGLSVNVPVIGVSNSVIELTGPCNILEGVATFAFGPKT